MNNIVGLNPIARINATILVLGSMPGDISLQKQEYYGHQRNAFWPIMFSLFSRGIDINDYTQRKKLLIVNKIAVWDVIQSCYRTGSLDSAIQMDDLNVNNFYQFFTRHQKIKKVCFNGAKAENIYAKFVLPNIKEHFKHFEYARLPSTSQAHAAMSLQDKTQAWKKEIINDLFL